MEFVAVPVMTLMMILTRNPKAMGKFTLPWYLQVVGWAATGSILLAAAGMIAADFW